MEIQKGARILSKRGQLLIKQFEGLVLHPYLDSASIPTIGWGTTHYENGKAVTMRDPHITEERAQQLFDYEAKSKSLVLIQSLDKDKIILNQNQLDSLISLSYNIGIAGLLGSTVYRLVKKNPSDPAIRDAFAMWNKITVKGKKVVNDGLTKRRKKEADFYFS